MKKLLLIPIIAFCFLSCKKTSTAPTSNQLEIIVSNVVSPTTYTITLTKGGVQAFNIAAGTENKTYNMSVTSGDSYSVTYNFTSGGQPATGLITFMYNGMNRGASGVRGSGSTTVTIF